MKMAESKPQKSSLEISLTKLAHQCVAIDAAAVVRKGSSLHEEWTNLNVKN
jgi:hypothetical protein